MLSFAVPASATTAQPFFETADSLNSERSGGAAAPLAGGRVLLVAGHRSLPSQPGSYPVEIAEIYDPATDSWSTTAEQLGEKRAWGAAAPLPNGQVIFTGGTSEYRIGAEAQVFDEGTGTFSWTGSMQATRAAHIAVPLMDGRVLVAGGHGETTKWIYLSSAEIYDPATGQFSPTGSMSTARAGAGAAPLPDGRVLVTGGHDGSTALASAEIYDPATGQFTPTDSMDTAQEASAVALSDGSVLVIGRKDIEEFDPATETFRTVALASPARRSFALAPLPEGRAILAGGSVGGEDLETSEIFVSGPSPRSEGLDLGTVAVSTPSAPQPLAVENLGGQDLEVEGVSIVGPDAADFEVVEDECTGETLAFGVSCDVFVRATPSASGLRSASLRMNSNAPVSPRDFPLAVTGESESGEGESEGKGEGAGAESPPVAGPPLMSPGPEPAATPRIRFRGRPLRVGRQHLVVGVVRCPVASTGPCRLQEATASLRHRGATRRLPVRPAQVAPGRRAAIVVTRVAGQAGILSLELQAIAADGTAGPLLTRRFTLD